MITAHISVERWDNDKQRFLFHALSNSSDQWETAGNSGEKGLFGEINLGTVAYNIPVLDSHPEH